MASAGVEKGPRNRLTCTECARRKIKCDKNIPCAPCSKRGLGDHCARPHGDRADISVSSAIELLMQRVAELERRDVDASSVAVSRAESNVEDDSGPDSQLSATPSLPANRRQVAAAEDLHDTAEVVSEHDSATILEFLAWGRRKDQEFFKGPENQTGPTRHEADNAHEPKQHSRMLESTRKPQIAFLSTLLPDQDLVRKLVAYHDRSLLWYHGSYNSWTFAKDLNTFYHDYKGALGNLEVNLQWVALLFAIVTGSLTCASASTLSTWGFEEQERQQLSEQWYQATITCLNLAGYLESHTIYAVSAISSLTISAHILGFSNTQSVLLSSGTRVAQSLGLHRLGEEDKLMPNSPPDVINLSRQRETGRRIWCQLCTQDWFSIPFADTYSINPSFFTTSKPLNCNDEDQVCQPNSTPTITSYCNYLYDIAHLIPELHNATTNAKTLYTKYEQVLQYDERMRKLATAYMPTFLHSNTQVSTNWPAYVPWGRRSLAICAAHKIIMIHRKFLGLSFTNPAFAFTRRTCLAACKTILKETANVVDEDGPVLWIDQAFATAAGIILILDAFYTSSHESDYVEHKTLAAQAISYLQRFEASGNKIAIRGIRLLSFLVQELETSTSLPSTGSSKRKRSRDDGGDVSSVHRQKRSFNLPEFLNRLSNGQTQALRGNANVSFSSDANNEIAGDFAWDAFDDLLPPQTGFGGDHLFQDFFSFTT